MAEAQANRVVVHVSVTRCSFSVVKAQIDKLKRHMYLSVTSEALFCDLALQAPALQELLHLTSCKSRYPLAASCCF